MNLQETNNIAPQGYPTVVPYLLVNNVEKEMEFLKYVFQAEPLEELKQPDGNIMHGEVRIGTAVIMLGRAKDNFPSRESMNYVYVDNADEVYVRALKFGATSIMEPGDRFYGNREGGFTDPSGNQWWIAQLLEVVPKEEMEKRLTEMQKAEIKIQ